MEASFLERSNIKIKKIWETICKEARVSSRKSNYMEKYFKIPDSLNDFVVSGGNIHAETLLKWHMERNNVKVLKSPIRFTRVKPGGIEEDRRIENRNNWKFGDT